MTGATPGGRPTRLRFPSRRPKTPGAVDQQPADTISTGPSPGMSESTAGPKASAIRPAPHPPTLLTPPPNLFQTASQSFAVLRPPAGVVKLPALERLVRPVSRPHSRTISTPAGRIDDTTDTVSTQPPTRPARASPPGPADVDADAASIPSAIGQAAYQTGQVSDRPHTNRPYSVIRQARYQTGHTLMSRVPDQARPLTPHSTRPASGLRKFFCET